MLRLVEFIGVLEYWSIGFFPSLHYSRPSLVSAFPEEEAYKELPARSHDKI
jgi:hypothetical protein